MINTINDAKTIGCGENVSTDRRLRCQFSFNLAFSIRNALRSELSWTHYRK